MLKKAHLRQEQGGNRRLVGRVQLLFRKEMMVVWTKVVAVNMMRSGQIMDILR